MLMDVSWTTHLASGSETEASIDLFGGKSSLHLTWFKKTQINRS